MVSMSNSITSSFYLEEMCREKCLIKSGRYYLCARGGSFKVDKDIVKLPYVFRDGRKPMSIEEIREICKDCYSFGKGVIEDNQFEEIISKNIRGICFQKKLLKEDYGFVCTRGGPTNDVQSKVRKPYTFKIGSDKMSLDTVIKICNGACIFSSLYTI